MLPTSLSASKIATMRKSFAVVALFLLSLFAEIQQAAADAGHFGYADQAFWRVEAGFAQSPIDIRPATAEPMQDAGDILLDYNPIALDIVDNHHGIRVGATGAAHINGRLFTLLQYHFHSPSEHTLEGRHFPLEAHFVHKAQNGRLAVIGVLFTEGALNREFQKVLDGVVQGGRNGKPGVIFMREMMPRNLSYYHYLGSLTTPPLSENVEWYVMCNPVELSPAQIAAFRRYYHGNNRAVQPLNDRPLLKREQ